MAVLFVPAMVCTRSAHRCQVHSTPGLLRHPGDRRTKKRKKKEMVPVHMPGFHHLWEPRMDQAYDFIPNTGLPLGMTGVQNRVPWY